MKKIHKDHAASQESYRARQREKQEAAAEAAEEIAKMKALDLRFFGESAYGKNAETAQDEIRIHRQFLRALSQSDVQDGEETLRQLSKRVWHALLNAKNIGVSTWPVHLRDKYESGYDAWIPALNPRTEKFDGWYGFEVCGALRPDWFDAHWQAPD